MTWPRYRKQPSLGAKEFHSYWRDRAYFFLDKIPRTGHRLSFKCERLLFVVLFLCCRRRNTSNKEKATGITKINKASSSVTSCLSQISHCLEYCSFTVSLMSGGISPPMLFFFLNIALVILGLLPF